MNTITNFIHIRINTITNFNGNQCRARMDQLGFVLGNGTIKGTFGFRSQAASTLLGNILTTGAADNVDLTATISAGIGYTSEPFGIGLGYNFTYVNQRLGVHTPVLMINALNNNLRIAIPIQIASSQNPDNEAVSTKKDYLGISTDVQIRYYTGIDAFNAIRVYFRYGQNGYKNSATDVDYLSQSLGFETRFYFLNTPVGNVTVNPYLKVAFDTALVGDGFKVRAGDSRIGWARGNNQTEWDQIPYEVTVAAVLGITANSDIVSLYVEPSLGYTAAGSGKVKGSIIDPTVAHKLYWGAYTELYIRPTQDLEWYFEMDVNNSGTKQGYTTASGFVGSGIPVYFETTTGITWYLPALN
ncbi:cell surface protein [Brachyspira hampsonii]|uniref:Cell surface protein n=1 Tax=Brachyspira hampsonii TaxID=1287055 RepID=A0A1E5NDK8_9SPIR|nr:cell surface protein [Brachyspira hampsonii]